VRSLGAALALACLAGCHDKGEPTTLTVSAAVSLKEPLEELGAGFERAHPGTKVLFNFAATGDLARQIEAGAPVDVFAAAAAAPMDRLAAAGRLDGESRRTIARNRLVLVARAADCPRFRFATLGSAPPAHLAIGDPRTVPAGEYADQLLTTIGAKSALEPHLLPAANVRLALDLVARGEAEAGIVYATDVAVAPALAICDTAPDEKSPRVEYPMAAIAGSPHAEQARAFVAYVASDTGRRAFAARGYLAP
jgi:molybdate transport system substrate-binding protein